MMKTDIETRKVLRGFSGFSNLTLKLIAIICMLIDHSAVALFLHMSVLKGGGYALYYDSNLSENMKLLYECMRIVGRLAFPIFAFFIAEGVRHTGNIKRYILRLGIFALLSEIPFHLLIHGTLPLWEWPNAFLLGRNVFFTLFLGAVMLALMRQAEGKKYCYFADAFVIAICCFLAYLLDTDYSAGGILIILTFYFFRWNYSGLPMADAIPKQCALFVCQLAIYYFFYGAIEIYAIASLLLIFFYNGTRGAYRPWMKWAFYAFYPVHLTLLGLICVYK